MRLDLVLCCTGCSKIPASYLVGVMVEGLSLGLFRTWEPGKEVLPDLLHELEIGEEGKDKLRIRPPGFIALSVSREWNVKMSGKLHGFSFLICNFYIALILGARSNFAVRFLLS